MIDIHRLSATELVEAYRARRLSPVEVCRATLDRIASVDPQINAMVLVTEEAALVSARDSEQRWQAGRPCGPIDGVPTTIKDLMVVEGLPTRRGSLVYETPEIAAADAPAVARLREAGAVFLGKTATPEFGWKGVTDCPAGGITRNPWNTACTPGGSSGGASAAAALGMGALHTGTDGGGSIRIPAGFTGIFGHKPTFGLVPAWPPSPFAPVSHVGPMTRTVEDGALMLTVMAQPDSRDWYASVPEARDYRLGLKAGVGGLRIAFSPALGHATVHPEVAENVSKAARVFESLGAIVDEVDPPISPCRESFAHLWYVYAAKLLETIPGAKHGKIDPGLRKIAEEGGAVSLMDHVEAGMERVRMGMAMAEFHQKYDLLLTPSLPVPAFAAGRDFPENTGDAAWIDWTPFSYPFNMTGQPASSVPCGFTSDGLPTGLQIVGAKGKDDLVLRAAAAYEAVAPFQMPDGPVSPGPA